MNSLRTVWHQLCETFRVRPLLSILLVGVLVYSAANILLFTSARDNSIPLWVLALLMSYSVTQYGGPEYQSGSRSGILAWTLIILAPLSLYLPWADFLHLERSVACMLTLLALLAFSNGAVVVLRSIPVLALCILIIPIQEQIFLSLSFPLRLLSTLVTAETLQVFGADISYNLTTITLGQFQIAITDACSGISQLAALILLGYIIVRMKAHLSPLYATLHYLIGEEAFNNRYHAGLGIAFVLLSTALLYGTGALFPEDVGPLNADEMKGTH